MKKYQLSRQYRLQKPQEMTDFHVKSASDMPMYGLIDTASEECVLITETMYMFLKQYENPTTLDEVAMTFASMFESTPEDVLPIIQSFFKDMKKNGVILLPKDVENIEIIVPFAVKTLIDSYRIEENLSINLPLEVYKATDLRTGQFVILKMLRVPPLFSEQRRSEWRELFKKEFAIQKILRGCPHVCQLLELMPEYAVLEWIEGMSLQRWLSENDALNTTLREAFLSQIIETYAFIHDKKILHGDVHARNILITGDSYVKIIDFDLALHLGDNHASMPVRGGAPEFIPPENIRFDAFDIVKGQANYRTEVYQIGIIAYAITYGKLPFTGSTWQELGTNILNNDIDFSNISDCGDTISDKMRTFLRKSLAKNPKQRFASAKEMQVAFKEIHMLNFQIF